MDQFLGLFGSVAAKFISSTRNSKLLHGPLPGSDAAQWYHDPENVFKLLRQTRSLIGRLTSILIMVDSERHLVYLPPKMLVKTRIALELNPSKFMWVLQWLPSKMEHVSVIECRNGDRKFLIVSENFSPYKIFKKFVTWLIARANAAMTVSQNDIHMIGGRNANGQLLKSVEYCEPGVIGKWKKVIG